MGRQLLNTRCVISTFINGAKKLLDSLDQLSKDALSTAGVLPLFTLSFITQNIPLLYTLISLYDITKGCFVIGGECLYFTVNDVALILGLPNRGEEFYFRLRPLASMNKHVLKDHLNVLANEASHPMSLRLDYLVRYLLCCFFFPQKTYDIPLDLFEFSGFEDFSRYNWPQAVHQYLDAQLPRLSKKAKLGDVDIGVGYISGCSIVLVIWILERTKYCEVPHPEARPRICRYSEKTSISYEACKNFSRIVAGKVLSVMDDITSSEAELLMNGDEDHDESPLTSSKKEPHRKRRAVSSSPFSSSINTTKKSTPKSKFHFPKAKKTSVMDVPDPRCRNTYSRRTSKSMMKDASAPL